MMKYVNLCLISIILVSCSGFQNQTPTPITTKTILPVLTETQTVAINTLPPEKRETAPSVITETQAVALKTPTSTLESTPIPTSTVYEFPSWMKSQETVILAALFTDDVEHERNIYFFNAATEEKFELNPTIPFGGFFWYDNTNFGLLSDDLKISYKYNLRTGEVSTESVPSQSTRFLTKDWVNGLITYHDQSSDDIIFDDVGQTNKSLIKLYTAEWNENKILTVTDNMTNQVVWEYTLPENRYGTEFIWSPVNESQLVFLQGSPEPLNGFITKNMTLTFVDVVKGKILSSYNGDFGIIRWSPNGKMILYQDPWFRYRNFGIAFRNAPCLLILETGENRCLGSIPHVVPTGYELLTTGVYEWATDSNSIYYTYLYTESSQWNILGNLCNYSLIDGRINCPTQKLDVMHGRSVIIYDISPDEQYIHFCYSASTILNDYADTADDGIIKTDGSGFFSWVGAIQDDGPQSCSIDTLWRPLP